MSYLTATFRAYAMTYSIQISKTSLSSSGIAPYLTLTFLTSLTPKTTMNSKYRRTRLTTTRLQKMLQTRR